MLDQPPGFGAEHRLVFQEILTRYTNFRSTKSARNTSIQSKAMNSTYINALCTSIWSPVSSTSLLPFVPSPRTRTRLTTWANLWTRATTAVEIISAAVVRSWIRWPISAGKCANIFTTFVRNPKFRKLIQRSFYWYRQYENCSIILQFVLSALLNVFPNLATEFKKTNIN